VVGERSWKWGPVFRHKMDGAVRSGPFLSNQSQRTAAANRFSCFTICQTSWQWLFLRNSIARMWRSECGYCAWARAVESGEDRRRGNYINELLGASTLLPSHGENRGSSPLRAPMISMRYMGAGWLSHPFGKILGSKRWRTPVIDRARKSESGI
jgi:hypothetical protein